jgi:UDPglucose 6-dehydrogenase
LKIAVVGAGYVGLANAFALSVRHDVVIHDIDGAKVASIARGVVPLKDAEMETFIGRSDLSLTATADFSRAVMDADVVLVATPTNYLADQSSFDTSIVESVVANVVKAQPQAVVVIKSTIPVGFTEKMKARHPQASIVFSPEFLREGKALHDCLYPSRIVVGGDAHDAKLVADLFKEAAIDTDVSVLVTGPTEAETIKLFSNAYLAVRVAFFNELDSFAMSRNISAHDVVTGVSLDPRIGDGYNNPSFGYGGYCLPKDVRQLRSEMSNIPSHLIASVDDANEARKDYVVQQVLALAPRTVGVYRLAMKAGSDNNREASVFGVIDRLIAAGVEILVYEPEIDGTDLLGYSVVHDLTAFEQACDVILANRSMGEDFSLSKPVISRDLFGVN